MTTGLVIFVDSTPRNVHVAAQLRAEGLATELLDLIAADDDPVDLDALADQLVAASDALATRDLPIGYFAGTTGCAAALIAAARRPDAIAAVVARGGRPDLAANVLGAVRAPTLLIVGGADKLVVRANRESATQMTAPHQVSVILGASHLFDEPGALDEVGRLAASWFLDHFTPRHAQRAS